MTVNLALDYVPRRMRELGYGNKYMVRFRHLLLQPNETRQLSAPGELYLLIEPSTELKVESDSGLFDLSENLTNELQYEHQGMIAITNYSAVANHARFIQVIPKL